jgi:histidinol-phosphate phosphatase family protein
MVSKSIVFLDRDGTINRNYEDGPVYDANRFHLLPGAAAGIRLLNDLRVPVIVVTNQGGINHKDRDFGWEEYRQIERLMHNELAKQAGAHVDAVYVCHHADYEKCDCRKPAIGLFNQAAKAYRFERSRSYMVGDGEADIVAGKAMGLKTILVESGWEQGVRQRAAAKGIVSDKVVPNLLEAARSICRELAGERNE